MKPYVPVALASVLACSLSVHAQTPTQFGILVQHAATRSSDGLNKLTDVSVNPTPAGQVSEMHWVNAHYIRSQSSTIYGDSSATFTGNPVFNLFTSAETNNDLLLTIVNRAPAATCPEGETCTNPAYYPDGTTITRDGTQYYLNDLNAQSTYKQHVKAILNYHLNNAPNRLPGVVQIENEPNATRFYAGKYQATGFESDSSRMSHYLTQLQAAINAIRSNSAFDDVKITDGGTTSDPLCIMTWDSIYAGDPNNLTAANSFGKKLLHHGETSNDGTQQSDIVSWLPSMSDDFHNSTSCSPDSSLNLSSGDETQYCNMLQAWRNSVQLMTAYNTLSGLDYVNIHFYKKVDTTTADQFAAAFGTVIGYLRDSVVPNKTIISTEMGQYDQDSAVVTAMINKINNINSQSDHQLPVVIWYDADGHKGDGTVDNPDKTVAPYGLHWGNNDTNNTTGIGCINDSGSAYYQALSNGNLPSHCEIDRYKP